MFDTHAHLNFKAFASDYKKIIDQCVDQDLKVINVGADIDTSEKAVEISNPQNQIFASVGVHPLHARENINYATLFSLAENKSVVAVGEIGLDSYSKADDKLQKKVFLKQFEIAQKLDLSLILHCRKRHNALLEILPEGKGVIHCFTGTSNQAKQYIQKGYFVGFNGIIFKLNLEKVIASVPVEKILLETDSPFLHPLEKDERNTPLQVKTIAKKVARIKGIPVSELEKITDQNSYQAFQIE